MMSLASSVASPPVVVVMAIVDLGGVSVRCKLGSRDADIVSLISILRFVVPALAMVLTVMRF